MGVLKVIVYPVGSAILTLFAVTLASMSVFGSHLNDWAPWQTELVSKIGTIAGFVGLFTGSWLAIRSEKASDRMTPKVR